MKIKRFLARDMRAAFRMVREEQGPDAVILSSRRIGDQIEVVAALDYDAALVQQAVRRNDSPEPQRTQAAHESAPRSANEAVAPVAGAANASSTAARGTDHVDPAARREDVNPFASELAQAAAPNVKPEPTIVWAQDPHIERLERELGELRSTIQSEMGQIARGAWEFRNLEHAHVAQQLERMGFEHALTTAAVRTLPQDAVRPTPPMPRCAPS